MKQWEYKSDYIALLFSETQSPDDLVKATGDYLWQQKLQDELNKFGSEGWELVAITPEIISGEGIDAYAVFKRAKED